MLVLTRKMDQKIHLGDDITITVLRVRGNTIRLGIDAPRDLRVVRGELPPLDTGAAPAAEPVMLEKKAGRRTAAGKASVAVPAPSAALPRELPRETTAGDDSVGSPLAPFMRSGAERRQESAVRAAVLA